MRFTFTVSGTFTVPGTVLHENDTDEAFADAIGSILSDAMDRVVDDLLIAVEVTREQ